MTQFEKDKKYYSADRMKIYVSIKETQSESLEQSTEHIPVYFTKIAIRPKTQTLDMTTLKICVTYTCTVNR